MTDAKKEKRDLLIKIAKMYYMGGMSQEEIAKTVHVSRPTVSRLLKSCLNEGIVQIRIDDISSHGIELGHGIEEKYRIRKALVAPSGRNPEESKQNVGAAAALYLESILESNLLLGINWGTTLGYTVKNVRHNSLIKTDVIQLVGGMGNKTKDTDANSLVLSLAGALNGDSYLLQAPFMVKSKVLKELLMDEPHIKEHFEWAKRADIALIGLGSTKPEQSAHFRSGHITLEDSNSLRQSGAVGDICGAYIDGDGSLCRTDLMDKTIAISPDDLQKIPTVICVACGEEKIDIIKGALKGGYINVLITDRQSALSILSEE